MLRDMRASHILRYENEQLLDCDKKLRENFNKDLFVFQNFLTVKYDRGNVMEKNPGIFFQNLKAPYSTIKLAIKLKLTNQTENVGSSI